MYVESVGYEPTALEHFSPDLHAKFQEYSASTSARSDRALLRFNGGWEHMLKTVLGVNFLYLYLLLPPPRQLFLLFLVSAWRSNFSQKGSEVPPLELPQASLSRQICSPLHKRVSLRWSMM